VDSLHWSINTGVEFESNELEPELTFYETGDYLLNIFVKDTYGCWDSASKVITVMPVPKSKFSYSEVALDGVVMLNMTNKTKPLSDIDNQYRWEFVNKSGKHQPKSSNEPEPTFYLSGINRYDNIDGDEWYTIKLVSTAKLASSDEGCSDTITRDYLFKGLYIPTAFAPTTFEDEEYRMFQPKGKGLKSYRIEVYDRWGTLLWFSEDLQNGNGDVVKSDEDGTHTHPGPGWDGKYNGDFVPVGVYTWKVRAVFWDGSVWEGSNAGEDKDLSGSVIGTVTVTK
jgi:hypothetical protein